MGAGADFGLNIAPIEPASFFFREAPAAWRRSRACLVLSSTCVACLRAFSMYAAVFKSAVLCALVCILKSGPYLWVWDLGFGSRFRLGWEFALSLYGLLDLSTTVVCGGRRGGVRVQGQGWGG